jgi:hypothetical protein
MGIPFGVFLRIPETDADGVATARADKADVILKPYLLSKQWKDLCLQDPAEFSDAIGLQSHGDVSSNHQHSLLPCAGVSENPA